MVLILAITIIFFVGAIIVDLGLDLTERRGMQRAADFAALSGSLELPSDVPEARDIAMEWAARNGYEDGEDGVQVEVEMLCSNTLTTPPTGICDNNNPNGSSVCSPQVGCDSMRVIIRKPGVRLFSGIFGSGDIEVGSGAVAALSFEVIPLDSVLLLDDTSSMGQGCNGSQSNPGCPVREAKIAARDFTDVLLGTPGALSKVGYAPYRGCYNPPRTNNNCVPTSRVINLTTNRNTVINAINLANAQGGTGTNVCLPFTRVITVAGGPTGMFNSSAAQENSKKSVVILTDGDNNWQNDAFGQNHPPTACRPTTNPSQSQSDTDCGSNSSATQERQLDTATRNITNTLKAAPYNTDIYVVGLSVCGSNNVNQFPTTSYCSGIGNSSGDNTADRRLLKCIASSTPGTNDHYYEVQTASQLPDIFEVIALEIAGRALVE
jgi:hypothetical protein